MRISEIIKLVDLDWHGVDVNIYSKYGNSEMLLNTDINDYMEVDNFIEIIGDLEVTMIMPFNEAYVTFCCESLRKPEEVQLQIKLYESRV